MPSITLERLLSVSQGAARNVQKWPIFASRTATLLHRSPNQPKRQQTAKTDPEPTLGLRAIGLAKTQIADICSPTEAVSSQLVAEVRRFLSHTRSGTHSKTRDQREARSWLRWQGTLSAVDVAIHLEIGSTE